MIKLNVALIGKGIILANILSPVAAEVKIETNFKFYAIYPTTKIDIKQELHKRTPIIINSKKFRGDTKWYINWRFKWKENAEGCQIHTVKAELAIQHTMPKIPDDFPVNSNTRNAFEKYYNALLKHELGHKNSGVDAAHDIEKELLSLGVFKSCQKLEQFANKKGKSIIEQYDNRDKKYDQITNHGRLDGVDIDLYITE